MSDKNSCSKLEHNYTHSQVFNLVQAIALYQDAAIEAIKALGTPDSHSSTQIVSIAAINLTTALTPFRSMIPEFLRHD